MFGSDCAVGQRRGVQHMTVCLQQVNFYDIYLVAVHLKTEPEMNN